MNDRLRAALKNVHRKLAQEEWHFGFLGRHNSDSTYTYAVRGRANYVYVTLRLSSGAQTVIPARNDAGVPFSANLPVRMRLEHGTYIVDGVARRDDLATVDAPPESGVPIHIHDDRYFREDEHVSVSAGAADAGKPAVLDAGGKWDASLIDSEDIADIVGTMVTGNTETDIAVTYQDSDNTLDFVVSATLVADRISAASTDDTIGDTDLWGYVTGGVLVKTAWSNIKAVLKTYFDTLYGLLATANTWVQNQTIASTQTTGNALRVVRDLAAASTDSPVVDIVQDNTGDDQAALRVQQDGTGQIIVLLDGANEVFAVSDGGIVNIGADALATNQFNISGGTAVFNVTRYAASTSGPVGLLRKSRNASVGSHTIVQADDELGRFDFRGSDGSAFRDGAIIIAVVDGTPGASDMPGRLELRTTPDGSTTATQGLRVDSAQNVMIGSGAAAARLHILQPTLGSPVQRLQSTATNDDPTEDISQNRVATTDATVTTLHTVTVASGKSYLIKAHVLARRTGGASGTANDSAAYGRVACVKDVSGTATLVGAVASLYTMEDQAGWDVTIDVTGGTARVRVTGAASNNVTWHLERLEVAELGT